MVLSDPCNGLNYTFHICSDPQNVLSSSLCPWKIQQVSIVSSSFCMFHLPTAIIIFKHNFHWLFGIWQSIQLPQVRQLHCLWEIKSMVFSSRLIRASGNLFCCYHWEVFYYLLLAVLMHISTVCRFYLIIWLKSVYNCLNTSGVISLISTVRGR